MSDYQRSYSREDPRLVKHTSSTPSKEATRKSPPRDPRSRTSSSSSWNSQVPQNTRFTEPPPTLPVAYQQPQSNTAMYNNSQYPSQGYYTGYENYQYNPYQYPANNQQAQPQQYMSGAVQPGPPGEEYQQSTWNTNNVNDFNRKSAGVVDELNKQKAALLKERETYEDRVSALKKKLTLLVDQKDQLSKHSIDRETAHIIKENTKLQVEIQSKIKDANNVIEILSGLIGDKKTGVDEKDSKSTKVDDPKGEKVNYKHYDPEIHWCRMCDVFPQSAKELLVHLHSKQHQDLFQEEVPWHKLPPETKFQVFEGAPVRRLPIKGLQFFVAATAWYCRLCDSWIGDLHCASQHLMSVAHSQNYTNFVEQNPHWEIEWLKDREKAFERIKRTKSGSDSDDKKKRRRKDKYSPTSNLSKDKKKKKRSKRRRKHSSDSSSSSSSSSSSDEENDKSKSIRVAMRNKMKMLSESDDKWEIINKLVEEERKRKEVKETEETNEDSLIGQWVPISGGTDKDKQLLDSLKEKLKQKQDAEKAKLNEQKEKEISEVKRQKEKEELAKKLKEKEAKEAYEREAEKRKDDKKMSMRIKDQPKISRSRDNYRRRSPSRSPEARHRRSRSRSNGRYRNGRRSQEPSPNQYKEKEEDKRAPFKKLPFIGRMPLFKGQKGKKQDEDKKEKEIQREDYDIPRKTRFQPGNLARAFIPDPDVVCFPKLSFYPPIAPPPPVPEPPQISIPKPPPPPKIETEVKEVKEKTPEKVAEPVIEEEGAEYGTMYEDPPSSMMYQYGNMDYNMMYHQQAQSFDFMQVMSNENDPDVPNSHKMPLQPPPLPPDDPNDDLAMLGISSDDMAAQPMFINE